MAIGSQVSFRYSRRGWLYETDESYITSVELDAWLGHKYPGLHKHWLDRQMRFLQQRIDGE
jgi:hypothetical protein